MTNTYTFSDEYFSDFHKDAFGFRPSRSEYEWWSTASDAEKQSYWDRMGSAMEARTAREAEWTKIALSTFEKLVADTIANGAKDVATAHRWIMEASSHEGDWEFLCYDHGLPYGYFKKVQHA